MGITRLKRKARRNKLTAAKRQNSMQQLNTKPVIKNIDKEAIKKSFGTAPAAPVKEEAPVVAEATAVVEEVVAEAKAEVVATETEAEVAVETAEEASSEAVEGNDAPEEEKEA